MAAAGTGHDMVLRMLADTNQYLREIRKAQTATHHFRDAVAGAARFIRDTMSTAFGVMGGNFLTGAISGITGRIWEWVKGGFSLAASLEESRMSFGVMFRSVELGNALVQQLYLYAARTVFEFQNVNKAAMALAGSGVAQDQILPVLKLLGELGNTTTRPLEHIAELYGKIRSRGKITGEEIRQFGALGIPVIEELAKQFGVSKQQLFELVEQGLVGFPAFQRALQSLASEGGMFAGMQEKLAKTLPGLWATFKDSLAMASAELTNAIVEIFDIKDALATGAGLGEWLKQSIQQVTPAVKAWWEWFRANAANVFWDITSKALDFTAKLIEGTVKWFMLFDSILQSINSTIAKLVEFTGNPKLKALLMAIAPGATTAIEAAFGMAAPEASQLPIGGSGKPKPKTAGDIAMEAAAALQRAATAAAANAGSGQWFHFDFPEVPAANIPPMAIEPGGMEAPKKAEKDKDRDILAKALSGKDAYQAIYDAMKEQANAEKQDRIVEATERSAAATETAEAQLAAIQEMLYGLFGENFAIAM